MPDVTAAKRAFAVDKLHFQYNVKSHAVRGGGSTHFASFDEERYPLPSIILDVQNAKSECWGLAVCRNPFVIKVASLAVARCILAQHRICLPQRLHTSQQSDLFIPAIIHAMLLVTETLRAG